MTWSWWDHKHETPLPEICETPVETGGGFDAYVDQMLMCSVGIYQRDLTEKLS